MLVLKRVVMDLEERIVIAPRGGSFEIEFMENRDEMVDALPRTIDEKGRTNHFNLERGDRFIVEVE